MKKNLIFTLAIVFITTAVFAQRHETIICESGNGHRHWCSADTHFGVQLSRQLSKRGCIEGRSWGYNDRGVWVDDGCRAEFILGGHHGGGGYGREHDRDRREFNVTCESDYGHTHNCSVDTRGGVRITRQLSRATCTFNRTWGYDSRGIWVRDGCRAEFVVGR